MAVLSPYLNFAGNTEEAFNFYRSVFGGEFSIIQRFKDSPEAGHTKPEDMDKLMHISLPISNGVVLMGTDAIGKMAEGFVKGNNFQLSLATASEAEADKLFAGLSAGGTITVPLQKMFWGAYFGMVIDKFGMNWMVNYDYNEQ
jgi:PhnB protein